MKRLPDTNLSWRLVDKLKPHFIDCVHVDRTGLTVPAKDADIWAYALQHHFIIVTNDDDFLDLARIKGFPPKVVLLRTGNQRAEFLLSVLIKHKTEIAAMHSSAEIGLLEIV